MADRDIEIGGGIMAGALAYRIFVWLLPVRARAGRRHRHRGGRRPRSRRRAPRRSLGLQGVVSNSVAQASQGSSRWYAILIGIPILLWASRGLLKALIVVHRLIWGDVRREVPKPTVGATVRILLLLRRSTSPSARASGAVESVTGSLVLQHVVGIVLVFVWWLGVSCRLPHHGAPWTGAAPRRDPDGARLGARSRTSARC